MATIKEIAQQANVSISTASIVLRGESEKRKISPETTQRVMKAAQTLDYTPNVSARRLRAPQTDSLMISVFWATFWASEFRAPTLQFLRGLQSVLDSTQRKCEIMIHPYNRGHFAESLSRLSLCHAAIVCNATPEDMLAIEAARLPVPVVLHSRQSELLPCVYVDYTAAGKLPAKIFHSQGMKRAVLCVSTSPFGGASECEDAFIKNALGQGMSVQRIELEHTMHGGYEGALAIAKMEPKPDCVFFLSDVLALGALKGFRAAGVDIPGEMKLISLGCYDADMEEYAQPSLSVVQVPLEDMGAQCLRKALALISGGNTEEKRSCVPVYYVPRESCGPDLDEEE